MLAYYVHDLSPFLLEWDLLPGGGIRYYGLAYLLGFVLFYLGMCWLFHRGLSELSPPEVADLMTWVVGGVLIGGRLGYCLVYAWERTWADPLSVVAFWNGGIQGMSSHGGMVGVTLAIVLYAWFHQVSTWRLLDHAALLAPLGLFLGRIANFINGELWGRPTDVPWAVIFPAAGDVPRHPSQLYEAFGEGIFLFGVLVAVRRYIPGRGATALAFLVVYALVRFTVEFYREPDAHLGFLALGWSMGQWLSLGLLAAAVGIGLVRWRLGWNPTNPASGG